VRRLLLLVAGLLVIPVSSALSSAQVPLPTLRGIVLTESGEGRAYFEDPRTGTLTGFATRDIVGDCQIEQIRDNRVVMRRGAELVQVLLGVPSSTGAPASSGAAPILGNGQPWLDRFGIPPLALSRAIELALPAQASDNLDD